MNKLFVYSFILSALICLHGCKREKQYTIGLPIENCSLVSYDNHNLTDSGVNIYCPSGSIVVAAMDGIVDSISSDSSGWIIQTICPNSSLRSHYSYLDSVAVSVGDSISIYTKLGVLQQDQDFLHYELFRMENGSKSYLSPLEQFNSFFE
jgi:hypothetical protein